MAEESRAIGTAIPTGGSTNVLRQKPAQFTFHPVDAGRVLRDRCRSGEHSERIVVVAGSDRFRCEHASARSPCVALLELRGGDVHAVFRWPALPDAVEAVVEDTRPDALRSLTAVLHVADAVAVEVFSIIAGRLERSATFERGDIR